MNTAIQINHGPEKFLQSLLLAIAQAKEDFVRRAIELGRQLLQAYERYPELRQKVAELPSTEKRYIQTLERVARNQVLPELAFGSTPSEGRAALQRLPMSLQQLYIEEPVPVVLPRPDGIDVLKVAIDNLTPAQVRQVFARDHVRDEAAQRAWLESQATQKRPAKADQPYRYRGKYIEFADGSRKLISEMMIEMSQHIR